MFLEIPFDQDAKQGWIEVICGSMFSGKTEELIRRLKRAEWAKLRIQTFKPKVDTRYRKEAVVSHSAQVYRAREVAWAEEMLDCSEGLQVVGIDEAQFFEQTLVAVCNELANRGIRVIAAGLDMDFRGQPFGPMPQLMAVAEYVTKVHAICVKTGNLAHYSHRLVAEEQQLLLGEKEAYEPLSRAVFWKALREAERYETHMKKLHGA